MRAAVEMATGAQFGDHTPAAAESRNQSLETASCNSTAGPAATATCPICGTPFTPLRRSQRTCTAACKQALHRTEKRNAKGAKTPSRVGSCRTPRKPQFGGSQVVENKQSAVTVLNDLGGWSHLAFERINAVTWKCTDGLKIRHPGGVAAHGSDQTRAVAWLMEVGWIGGRQAWLVRMGDLSHGPTTFSRARAAAVLMVRGGFDKPVTRLANPTGHLNLQQAALIGGAS